MPASKVDEKPKEIYENKVEIPPGEDLWAFIGPGWLMSIAYLDPGNIEGDLQAGAVGRFRLIWVLLAAHVLGLVLQRLSARLGVTSGYHMAEVAFFYYPRVPRIILWLMVEIAIIASDMQEVIGTAIALYLLSNQYIPLWAGVLITIADTFTFLFLDTHGVRKFELFFCFLIAMMAATFGYEFVVTKPAAVDITRGTLMPWAFEYSQDQFIMGISVVGAVIMPHNLYLHSSLVKSRKVDRRCKSSIVEANKYFFIESALALTCSFFINLLVVSVFAVEFFNKTNADIREQCVENTNHMPDYYVNTFPNNTEVADSDIYRSGVLLGCVYGIGALYVWAVGIIASGQSSTMTGTYAGQFAMEGFLHIHISRWKRILITRSLAIFPTIAVVIFSQGVEHITGLNDLLNCIQMLQLPFALLPVLTFTADPRIMKEFAAGKVQKFGCLFISVVVMGINYYFLFEYVDENYGMWYGWTIVGIFAVFYTLFALYMFVYCLKALGFRIMTKTESGLAAWFPDGHLGEFDAPWLNEFRATRTASDHEPQHEIYCL
ncbi:hypothetical protein M3Y99_00486600 [Aphelenchoides fujianensis]|nr:hypothetical protein M3Y99_00486600 [Aphelenchoides fujianensis]